MRALVPAPAVLALLVLALLPPSAPALAPAPAPAAPRTTTHLLVLRAACPLRQRAAFDPLVWREASAAARRPPSFDDYRLLPYNETCGKTWSDSVVEAVVEALGGGEEVVVAGWAGLRACVVLSAARRVQPAPCAGPAARARVVLELAARLRWRRVLLLAPPRPPRPPRPHPPADECAATLRAARARLLLAALTVRTARTLADEPDFHPHVVLACAAQERFPSPAPAPPPASPQSRITTLLLRVASSSTNITSHVDNLPYVDNSSSQNVSVIPSLMGKINTIKTTNVISRDNDKEDIVFSNNERNGARKQHAPVLILSDVILNIKQDLSLSSLQRQVFDTIDNYETKIIKSGYYLYEYVAESKDRAWNPLTKFNTTAEYDSEEGEWTVTVETTNSSGVWERLRASDDEEGESGAAVWGALGACGAVALLAAAGGGARAVAGRRRGRRRRGDVVLAAADFTFPADEARRVPDGMETMLSCWLQQLHEFGGPELERPDLLLPAPPAAPAPPSAPSSTASGSRLALDRRTRYKGDPVHLKTLPLPAGTMNMELRRKATDVLLVLHNLRHENLNTFIGCVCEIRPSLVWDHCGRGSLEDVLMADEIKLDWTFRLSLLTDLARGLRYLHASPLRAHGRLSSRNCVVDSRWVLRLADYGQAEFYRAQGLTPPPRRARDLLWTAPELLRAIAAGGGVEGGEGGVRGTQPGDVFSFAIIMQEVIVRGEPYCMLALSPEEIVEKLCRPPPLIRPSVSMGAAPPEAVSVMRQCWAEAADMRPDTDALQDIFRLLHRGRKINIVDSMFEMLEKYSNNLEELIKDRTEQLDMEKKKTEQLLNRMLPRSVAERLLLGLRVEPEEFEEVSIYFSDIVGFTGIAARSTPVQVVALLNDLYTTFDAAIERYRVYKVETIGDAYMVVGGLPVRARDHAESVATMALHLLHLAGRFRVRHLPHTPLHLRIGLHSGPCCAGVVGLTMPRYCLFGDTVNTASRMESTGAAWRIQVSSATAARLEAAGGYRLRSRGLTMIKGKGAMHTYWLLGKDGFDKPLPTPPPLPSEETLMEHELEHEHEHECEGELEPHVELRARSPDAPAPTTAPTCPAPPAPHVPPAPHNDKYAWTRSGAVSADSSPPAAAPPYSRYRCLGGGSRTLRRQWSLERGEELAAAVARAQSPGELQPLALHAPRPASAAPHPPRYRTRPDTDAHAHTIPTSTSFD